MCVGSNLCCVIAVYFLAYFLACIVGHTTFFGSTERAVALTLVLMAPAYLPAFIGGWVVLKFAIGWQRQQIQPSLLVEDTGQVATQSFVALIGSVISFAIAIAVGLALYPEALNAWATRK
jgi:hypothetical protein